MTCKCLPYPTYVSSKYKGLFGNFAFFSIFSLLISSCSLFKSRFSLLEADDSEGVEICSSSESVVEDIVVNESIYKFENSELLVLFAELLFDDYSLSPPFVLFDFLYGKNFIT
jgi:hypothetical protein